MEEDYDKFIIFNEQGEILCFPDTEQPYIFESQEAAKQFQQKFCVYGVIAGLKEPEERYGGQNDLW